MSFQCFKYAYDHECIGRTSLPDIFYFLFFFWIGANFWILMHEYGYEMVENTKPPIGSVYLTELNYSQDDMHIQKECKLLKYKYFAMPRNKTGCNLSNRYIVKSMRLPTIFVAFEIFIPFNSIRFLVNSIISKR